MRNSTTSSVEAVQTSAKIPTIVFWETMIVLGPVAVQNEVTHSWSCWSLTLYYVPFLIFTSYKIRPRRFHPYNQFLDPAKIGDCTILWRLDIFTRNSLSPIQVEFWPQLHQQCFNNAQPHFYLCEECGHSLNQIPDTFYPPIRYWTLTTNTTSIPFFNP